MAWGKKDEELPARLRGKTPEQIAQELEAADGLKSKIEGLETGLASANSKFETFGTSLTQLNETLTQLGTRLPAPKSGAGAGEDGAGDDSHEPASFLTEPDRAFAERAAPLINVVLGTAARLAREEAFKRAQTRQRTEKGNVDGLIFEKFGKEIDDFAKACTPQQQANPDTWEHLFFNVKGRHSDEISAQRSEGKGEFFIESAGRATSSDTHVDDNKLTPLEEKLAARMGVKPEDYLKRKKEMQTGAIAEELLVKAS